MIKTKNKNKCKKGWSCGKSCISKTNKCRVTVKPTSKEFLNKLAKIPKEPGGGYHLPSSVAALFDKKSWTNEEAKLVNSEFKKLNPANKIKVAASIAKAGKAEKLTKEAIEDVKKAVDDKLKPWTAKTKKELDEEHKKNKRSDVSVIQQEALYSYSGAFSSEYKQHEAGVSINSKYESSVQAINNFIDESVKFEGELFTGFTEDMDAVLNINKLKAGDSFSFPSMTSTSSNEAVAVTFDGAGIIKIVNNKSGASIKEYSQLSAENEVLVPKKAKYRLINISTKASKDWKGEEKETPYYEIEEI